MSKTDVLCERIAGRIVADIQEGAGEWKMPWHRLAVSGTPKSVDGHFYRGVNSMILPMEAEDRGYTSPTWGTYRAWNKHGCQVRKGERSAQIVFWKRVTAKERNGEPGETDGVKTFWMARAYNVFNAEQCDGAERWLIKDEPPAEGPKPLEHAEAYFTNVGADVRHHGSMAFYAPVQDYIGIPSIEQFVDSEHYYSTLAHEHVHWTGHESRLNRDLKLRFGEQAYAIEELIAELGAAVWCAQHDVAPATRFDHAAYVKHWIQVLGEHPRHLLTVTNRAQAAVDHLNNFQPKEQGQ
jgi:antirestriction protein ArdC